MNDPHPTTHDPSGGADPTHVSDINLGLLATVGAVGAILLFVLVTGTIDLYDSAKTAELQSRSLGQANVPLMDLKFAQMKRIETYRWVDQKHGVVAIPVERAMELMIQRRQRQ